MHHNLALGLALLVAYQLKHFLCDFPLQRPWMLRKFSADPDEWVPALAAHAGVHALGTAVIAGAFVLLARPAALLHQEFQLGHGVTVICPDVRLGVVLALATFDFIVHFLMDRLKASPHLMGRWKNLTAREYQEAADLAKNGMPGTAPEAQEALKWLGGRLLRGNTLFWWSLGLDQMVHHLTHYAVVVALMSTLWW